MTKENKFYLWLVVGLVIVGGLAWWMQRRAAIPGTELAGGPPTGAAKTSP